MTYIVGIDRCQATLLPATIDDYVEVDSPIRVIDAFVENLDVSALGFQRATPAPTGRPCYDPSDLLKLYIYAYLNEVRSSRSIERECKRNVEAMWLVGKLVPDHKTIADFRRVNGAAIIATCRAFVLFCREQGLLLLVLSRSTVRRCARRQVRCVCSTRHALAKSRRNSTNRSPVISTALTARTARTSLMLEAS
ncbi:Transposase [Mesorhizobium sp. YR577]|nr:Transposase [Mesorhizobium sp. YR577]